MSDLYLYAYSHENNHGVFPVVRMRRNNSYLIEDLFHKEGPKGPS